MEQELMPEIIEVADLYIEGSMEEPRLEGEEISYSCGRCPPTTGNPTIHL